MCVSLKLSLQKCIHLQLRYLETDSEDKQAQQNTAQHCPQIVQTHMHIHIHRGYFGCLQSELMVHFKQLFLKTLSHSENQIGTAIHTSPQNRQPIVDTFSVKNKTSLLSPILPLRV